VTLGRRSMIRTTLLGASAFGACAAPPAGQSLQRLPDTSRPPERSAVAVVVVSEHGTLREAVTEVVRRAGGLSFIRPGQTVLVKPAVNSGNPYPATADPETVLTLVRLVQQAGGVPTVADRTMFLRSTAEAFRRTGILDAARQAGIPCLPLDDAATVRVAHPLAAHWSGGRVEIYRPVAEAAHVIDVCTPRTHRLGVFTMALKNLVGVVAGSARPAMHLGAGFEARLAEISLVVRPSLVVLDARQGFGDGGPDHGDVVRPGVMVAGTDPVAVDAVGLALLRLAGANPAVAGRSIWRIPQLARAVEIGAGVASASAIRLVGMGPDAEARLRAQMA
jgi:uncharacterized protein (DUF362 family)